MHFFTTYNEETKASIVESFNRTLKTKMWKYFTHRETLTYVDVLSEMVASYDHTIHRTTDTEPAEVTWANQRTVSKRLYERKGQKQIVQMFSWRSNATQQSQAYAQERILT